MSSASPIAWSRCAGFPSWCVADCFGVPAGHTFRKMLTKVQCATRSSLCCGTAAVADVDPGLVMCTQTVGQIVSAVGTKLDAIRQAQEDDSYIRRALSSNASTAHWPQQGAPQAAPQDGFANQSNDTVQVRMVSAKHMQLSAVPTSRMGTHVADASEGSSCPWVTGTASSDVDPISSVQYSSVQPRTVTAALGRLNMGSGQVRLPPVSAPAANAQAAPNAQDAAKVASAASSEQEEVGDMKGVAGNPCGPGACETLSAVTTSNCHCNAPPSLPGYNACGPSPPQVEALLREISASSAGGLEPNNYGDANGRGGPGSLGSKSAVNGSNGRGASHSSDSSDRQGGAKASGASGGGSLGSKDGIGDRPLKPLRGGSGGGKVGRQDDDAGGGDGDGGGKGDEGRCGRSGDDDEQSVVGSTTGPSGGRRASNPNLPDEVVEEVCRQ